MKYRNFKIGDTANLMESIVIPFAAKVKNSFMTKKLHLKEGQPIHIIGFKNIESPSRNQPKKMVICRKAGVVFEASPEQLYN